MLKARNDQSECAFRETSVRLAGHIRDHYDELIGKDGLLEQLTKRVVESALEGALDDHLGYLRHQPGGSSDGNTRNSKRAKMIPTDTE
jgi:putative transposase